MTQHGHFPLACALVLSACGSGASDAPGQDATGGSSSGGAGGNVSASAGSNVQGSGSPGHAGSAGTSAVSSGGKDPGTGGAATAPVSVSVIVDDALDRPRDLAFNPQRPTELWIVNAGDDAVTIVSNAPDESRTIQRRIDPHHEHFLRAPAALAFGAELTNQDADDAAPPNSGTFATCGEDRGHDNFMGPVLWSSDLSVFAIKTTELGSHLDMLHSSPLCMGIAWHGSGNIYWTTSGDSNAIVKYDFGLDHGIGHDDHSDGKMWRYAAGALGYEQGVPGHLFYSTEDKQLYLADPANSRIARLDTEAAVPGGEVVQFDGLDTAIEMSAELIDVVSAGSALLQKPSGLELHAGALYVSDNATSTIHRFGLDGQQLGFVQVDVEAGGLAGISFGPDGKLYFVDMVDDRVLRLDSGL